MPNDALGTLLPNLTGQRKPRARGWAVEGEKVGLEDQVRKEVAGREKWRRRKDMERGYAVMRDDGQ